MGYKERNDMKNIIKVVLYIFTCILLYIIIKNVYLLKELMYIILISYIIAFLIKPLQIKLMRWGVNEKKSAIIIIFISSIFLILIFFIVFPSLLKESEEFTSSIEQIKKIMISFQNIIDGLGNDAIISKINSQIYIRTENAMNNFSANLLEVLISTGEGVMSIFVIPIIVYYFLSDGEKIYKNIKIIVPMKKRNVVTKIIKDMNKILCKYAIVQILLSIIIGILTFLVLLFYKVKFPILLSFLNALLNIIPYFGPIFGAVPCVLMAITKSTKTGIWVSIWLLLLQQFEGNVLAPKLTSDKVDMHPLLLIFLLILGGKIAGFIGMVFAVPICIIIKIVYKNLNYYMY